MYLQAVAHIYHLYRRAIITSLTTGTVGLILVFSLVASPAASAISIGGPSDCDDNAIIRCGAHSTNALMSDYNSSAYVRAVYAYFGISQADMANLPDTNVAGRVTKNGNVFIDGQSRAVATDAVTGGRQNIAGSTRVNFQGATFYKRPPSVSFQQESLPAFVSMKNGRFQFAVIASCGNAVRAAATTSPPTQTAVGQARVASQPAATPQPKTAAPMQTQSQSQSQSQSQQVNVNNTNNNTQINRQTTAQQPPQTPAATPPTQTAAVQPATQNASSTLPSTGPTGAIGVFLTSVGVGVVAYRRFLLRQLGGQ